MPRKPKIIVTVSASSHPDYDLFGDCRNEANRQIAAKRGNQAELDAWYDKVAIAARAKGFDVVLINA